MAIWSLSAPLSFPSVSTTVTPLPPTVPPSPSLRPHRILEHLVKGVVSVRIPSAMTVTAYSLAGFSNRIIRREIVAYGADTFWIGGGFQVPSRMEGGVSFGQYRRNIGMNLPLCVVGSQLASLAAPGELL